MKKTIAIGKRPAAAQAAPASADAWVKDHDAGKMKRLTIDIQVSLHKRLKAHCAAHGTSIRELLVKMIEEEAGG